MATFKYLVFSHHRHEDGSYNVKIRVTHNREVRYIATTQTAYPADLTRSLKIKSPLLKSRLDVLVAQMQSAVAELSPFALDAMSCTQLVAWIRRKATASSFSLDFFEWTYGYAERMSAARHSQMVTALRAFGRFLGSERLDINAITASMLQDFADFVEKEPKQYMDTHSKVVREAECGTLKRGAASRYLAILKCSYEAAKLRYNDEETGVMMIPRSPFNHVRVKAVPSVGQKPMDVGVIRAMMGEGELPRIERQALDLFLLSFLMMGMNMADLFEAQPPKNGRVTYYRKKVRDRKTDRGEMRVSVPDEASPYLARLLGRDHWLMLSEHYKSAITATTMTNKGLKLYAERRGLEPFTFYAARHSWATIARKAGVEKATIDECLCHSGELKMADVYIRKDYDLLNDANKKVIHFVMSSELVIFADSK